MLQESVKTQGSRFQELDIYNVIITILFWYNCQLNAILNVKSPVMILLRTLILEFKDKIMFQYKRCASCIFLVMWTLIAAYTSCKNNVHTLMSCIILYYGTISQPRGVYFVKKSVLPPPPSQEIIFSPAVIPFFECFFYV